MRFAWPSVGDTIFGMKDSDPCPMPPEVQRAYPRRIDPVKLLQTSVYSEADRRGVLDALMRSLLEMHGDVWVPGWVAGSSNEVRVSRCVRWQDRSVVKSIEMLRRLEEYGGREGVDEQLARAMQPLWIQWWEGFAWRDWRDVVGWRNVVGHVLGPRQLAWMAAQYARVAIDLVWLQNRSAYIGAIEAAETWARVPSAANRQAAANAAYAADTDVAAYFAARTATADDAYSPTATASATVGAAAFTAAAAIDAVAARLSNAMDAYAAYAYAPARAAAAYERLAVITKRLITPTLITSASGMARASGELSASRLAPAVTVGALLGAGAMCFARRL